MLSPLTPSLLPSPPLLSTPTIAPIKQASTSNHHYNPRRGCLQRRDVSIPSFLLTVSARSRYSEEAAMGVPRPCCNTPHLDPSGRTLGYLFCGTVCMPSPGSPSAFVCSPLGLAHRLAPSPAARPTSRLSRSQPSHATFKAP